MGYKYDVPRLWSGQMGEVAAKQNEPAEGTYVTGQSLRKMWQAYHVERAFWNEDGFSVAVYASQEAPTRYGAVRVRHYRPSKQGPSPFIVFVHGGGRAIGDVDIRDWITHILCHLTGAAVINIDYTLMPDAHFPQQIHECCDVVAYIREQVEEWGIAPGDIPFVGDSMGTNMAAVMMLTIRDEDVLTQTHTIPLSYGAYGLKDSTSMRLLGGAWDELTKVDYTYYLDQYPTEPESADGPYFNVLGSDFSTGIPPCYIVVIGFGPLRDDLHTLAETLGLCNVPYLYNEVEGVIHDFLHYSKMLNQTMDVPKEAARFYAEHPIRR